MDEDRGAHAGGRRSRVREKLEAAYRAATPDEKTVREGDAAWKLLEAMPGALVLLDTDRRVLFWDDRARDAFGWTEREVLGGTPPFVAPDEWSDFEGDFGEILDGEPMAGREVRLTLADGSTTDFELWARRLDVPGGEPVGVVFVLLDTGRREEWRRRHEASERRYRELLDQNAAGAFRSRRDGSHVRVLESSVLIEDPETGREEIVGSVVELVPPPPRQKAPELA